MTEPASEQHWHARMWADLFLAELDARHATDRVTARAEFYQHAGLPLDEVLDALKLDAAGWATRVAALRAHERDNRAAARTAEPLDPSPVPDRHERDHLRELGR
jgi:hypothetical protein